jgi:Polysaccharide lyase
MLIIRPWEDEGLVPDLTISPGIGIGLDDSVAVAPGRHVALAEAVVAPRGTAILTARPVVVAKKGGPVPQVGISPGRPLGLTGPIDSPPPTSPPPSPATPAQPEPVAAPPPPPPTPAPAPAATLVANFENGLNGWSTAPAGNIPPRVTRGVVRDGGQASLIRLTGDQSRSLLILGGEGGNGGAVQIREGDEYAFAFSFYIQSMVYGDPGTDNVIVQFMSDASDTRSFGLQLWQAAIDDWQLAGRGLWASGEAMGGNRFLAPIAERVWHDVVIHFRASSQGAGFYELYLDGELIDARSEISLIAPGSSYAQIEVGLLRDGSRLQGTSEIRLDAATLESVQP